MLTRRRLLAALGAGAAAVAVAGCGPDTSGPALDRIRRAGVARVGIAGEQPFGYSDTSGRVTGESPEVARAVLATLGVGGIQAVQVAFDQLIPGLLDHRYDIVTAGLTITPDRCGTVAFSRPDFLAPPAFLVRTGNPYRITSFADVGSAGVKLGVLTGSAERGYARAAGVEDGRLEYFDTQSSLFRAVAAGKVPAGALTRISLLDVLRRNPGSNVAVTDDVRPVVDGELVVPVGGFAFRPADTDLITAFDAALGDLQHSGQWLRIAEPFGFAAANLPPPGLPACGPVHA